MPLTYVRGDPRLTQAQTLAFGHNAKGQTELGALKTLLMTQYPAAFARYSRLCKNGRCKAGATWMWNETKPKLLFMTIRDSGVGATRLRYVQSSAMDLARDYQLQQITSLAIAPLGLPQEWGEVKLILETWFVKSALPVIVYDEYLPDIQAEENL